MNVLKNGTRSTSARSLHIRALSKWKFNPPSAPHQSGIWERLVRSFKRVMYNILGTRCLTAEVLNTTFRLVEYALNSEPFEHLELLMFDDSS